MNNLNILIPIGGKALRFYQAGYTTYKPFLPVGDKTMIERVIENVMPSCPHRFFLSIRPEDYEQFVQLKLPNTKLICDTKQFGQAHGCLFLEELIDSGDELMIVNADQLMEPKVIDDFLADCRKLKLDGSLITFNETDPKWSYVIPDVNGFVSETVEKPESQVSTEATVGVYWWRHGSDFVRAAHAMITARDTVNGEYYVCPAYNYLPRTKRISFFHLEDGSMHGLGTPDDYKGYLASHV